MKQILSSVFLVLLLLGALNSQAKKLQIAVVTGGHNFDRISFFRMWDSFQELTYTELKQPKANLLLGQLDPKTIDAVVFYDMPKTISEAEKGNYYKLMKAGIGLVFLHHAQCSYQDWEEYKSIVGGKYYEKPDSPRNSTYQHDVSFEIQITDPNHPVTSGIQDFEIQDEVYGNTEVLPDATPLLITNHPKSSRIIGWTHQKENSRIVYIQPGHDKNAWDNPYYQKLVRQAIAFVANK
ncbi:MAG: ThuA domain-containing protein [Prolixibacteraceae bacterium]